MSQYGLPLGFDIQQEQSQIIQSNNIDASIMTVANILSVTMELDSVIEELRLKLSENPQFYSEQVFAYLKNYQEFHKNVLKKQQDKGFSNFFDFDFNAQVSQLSQNLINSSKDGMIQFQNVTLFLQDQLGYQATEIQIQTIEKIYHTNQYPIGIGEGQMDANFQYYPLPADVQKQIQHNNQRLQDQHKQIGNQHLRFVTPEQEINSGNGFNYNTFLKLFLSHSIPSAKNKVMKRKLIYESVTSSQVDAEVNKNVAELFRFEIQLHEKSEILRIRLAQDPYYHALSIFQAMDIKQDNAIDFQSLQHVMQRTQHEFKPKGFSAIVRRSRILGGQLGQIKDFNSITFEDFKQLTQVRSAYFKRPNHTNSQDNSNNSTVMISGIKSDRYQVHKVVGGQNLPNSMISNSNYSQILGTNIEQGNQQNNQSNYGLSRVGSSQLGNIQLNSKIRVINIDDHPQQKSITHIQDVSKTYDQSRKFQPGQHIPIHFSDNLNVTQMIKNQVQPNNQLLIAQQEDHIIYGTKKDWAEMQHNSYLGQPYQPVQQSRSQSNLMEVPTLVRPSTNFDQIMNQGRRGSNQYESSRSEQADYIAAEAQHQLQLHYHRDNQNVRELKNAQHANTKFQTLTPSADQQYQQAHQGAVQHPPWHHIDKQTQNNVNALNHQLEEIKRVSGLQPNQRPIQQSNVSPQLNKYNSSTPQIRISAPDQQARDPNASNQVFGAIAPNSRISDNNSLSNQRNLAKHSIFGGLSEAQRPLQFTDQSQNNLLNSNYDDRNQILPKFDIIKI